MAETEQLLNRAGFDTWSERNVPEELLIDVSPFESRVALVQDSAVEEVHLARAAGYSSTGNIYLGKVVRVFRECRPPLLTLALSARGFSMHQISVARS